MDHNHAHHPVTDRAWGDADVRFYLGVSQRQLTSLLDQPGFPVPQRLGGLRAPRRWDPEAIRSWVAVPELKRAGRASRLGEHGSAERI